MILAKLYTNLYSLVYTSALNSSQTTRKQFANQMRVCVDGTANLRCTIRERLAYHLPKTQRELDAPGVLSMHRVSFARLRLVEN